LSVLDEILARFEALPKSEQDALVKTALAATPEKWVPNPGPQTLAYFSQADELFYGGSAGGGKSDLIFGLALTQHKRSLLLRRTNKEASKMAERIADILGGRDGYNGQDHVWRLPEGRLIDIGGVQLEDDKQKYKGTPHDLIGWDEISDFTESQFRFINTWNRTAIPGQRARVVAAGNPPTTPEGLWVIKYWAPWLDETHPNPARPGELRWFTSIAGEEKEVDGPGPYDDGAGHMVLARSRSYIPAKLEDNPDYERSGYRSVLASLPAELRAAYYEGKFNAALRDAPFQVIPTQWVMDAQSRWKPDGRGDFAMTAMGFDPAGGGEDSAELAIRYGGWVAPLVSEKGKNTADGDFSAATIFKHRKDGCVVVVDMGGGYGGAVALRLKDNGVECYKFNGAEASSAKTRDGAVLSFRNKRAEAWWRVREMLNPEGEDAERMALPPDPELRADLCAPTWELTKGGILVESKDDIRKRLGRSTNKGDAVVLCLSQGDAAIARKMRNKFNVRSTANIGHSKIKERLRGH
jgi:hypothetical protein